MVGRVFLVLGCLVDLLPLRHTFKKCFTHLNTWEELPNFLMSKMNYKKKDLCVRGPKCTHCLRQRRFRDAAEQQGRAGAHCRSYPRGANEELDWWQVSLLPSTSLTNRMWHWHKDRCWICLSDAGRSRERDPPVLNVQAGTCSSTLFIDPERCELSFSDRENGHIICLSKAKFP